MADISPPHIERIGDPSTGARDDPSPRRGAKTVTGGKPSPREGPTAVPEIAPAEEDPHELDELA